MQNYAARVIMRFPMLSNITTHLKSLHWLPVKVRSTYKIACLCYHYHSSTAPSYVAHMLQKRNCTPTTLAPAHAPCLFSVDLHTARRRMSTARFLLILLERRKECVIFMSYSSENLMALNTLQEVIQSGSYFTAKSTEAKRINCLAHGHRILMPGFEPSTSVPRNRHSRHIANMLYLELCSK